MDSMTLRNRPARISFTQTRALALLLSLALSLGLIFSPALAQQKIHEEYTKKILEFTTDPCFTTKYVNY
ncbi:MAG: hypothetical protein ACXW2V_10095, partial [Candidatus Aminicenantales bacterium]